jgi:ABC-type antimicrobial peptide transport system permease subunit
MALMLIFGGAALLLAAIGIYGLMAFAVEQRRQEIGIRVALGARAADVRRMVVWQGMRLALIGIATGIAASLGLTRVMASLLYGVPSRDPLVFATVPLVLSMVALLGVWLPARRASRIDPIQALRE